MASVNILKIKNTQAGGKLIAHMCRYDGREGVEYKNQDIDCSRSCQNWVIGETGESWRQLQTRLESEVKEIDSRIPPRQLKSDRITLTSVSIPCPEQIQHNPEMLRKFFDLAYKCVQDFCGGHCGPGFVHMDEVHSYRDRDGALKESRPHMHVAVIPFTEERGVNCKAFMSRDRLREINRDLDQRCREKLGVKMLTGEAPAHRRVEEMKAESARAERIFEEAALRLARDSVKTLESRAQIAARTEYESRSALSALESKIEASEQRLTLLESPASDKRAIAGMVMLREEEYQALLHRDKNIQALESQTAQLREERRQRYRAEDRAREYKGALDMERMMNSPAQKERAIERAVEPYKRYLEERGLLEDFDRTMRISKSKSLGQTPR